jgi:hypothetical protein
MPLEKRIDRKWPLRLVSTCLIGLGLITSHQATATSLGTDEQIFNFDLRTDVPPPPYTSLQITLQFSPSDPVTDSDQLRIRMYGRLDGSSFISNVLFPNSVFENGGTFLTFSTANAIYDPMLDGLFSIGLSMDAGTSTLTSIASCGVTAGLCSSQPVPEPGTLILMLLGSLGLLASVRHHPRAREPMHAARHASAVQ